MASLPPEVRAHADALLAVAPPLTPEAVRAIRRLAAPSAAPLGAGMTAAQPASSAA